MDEFRLDIAGLPGGLHIIRGEVLDVYGQTVSAEVTITVKTPPLPPPTDRPLAEPAKAPESDGEDDGDETMFMPDVETSSPDNAATLTVVKSNSLTPGTVFSVSATTRIGRIAKNDIDIPDKSVSRKYMEIYYENGACHIRDLGSQNGVKVNDARVSLTGMPLTNGAVIRLEPQTVLGFAWQGGDMDETNVVPDDSTKIY